LSGIDNHPSLALPSPSQTPTVEVLKAVTSDRADQKHSSLNPSEQSNFAATPEAEPHKTHNNSSDNNNNWTLKSSPLYLSSNLIEDQSSSNFSAESTASPTDLSCSSSNTFGRDNASSTNTPASTHPNSSTPTNSPSGSLSSVLGHTCQLCGKSFDKQYLLR
jgi:hypothetical protein